MAQGSIGEELFLRNGFGGAGDDFLNGAYNKVGAHFHHAVVDGAGIVLGQNGDALLQDDAACVNVVVQEEGGHAGFLVPVDDSPVDGGGTAVLRQQGGMEVEGAQWRHGPYHLGQHAECHHNLQVGIERLELLEEVLVAQTFGLQHRYVVAYGKLLYWTGLQHVVVAAYGLVGHGYYAHDIITLGQQALKRGHRKVGRAHIYDSQILFHVSFFMFFACKVTTKS